MLDSPPAALHVQSPSLPSLEQCSDAALTHPLLRFLHRSIYRQHTPDPDCLGLVFFLFARQPWCSLGREQVSSASGSSASVRHRQRQGDRDKCSHPPMTLVPKLMRSHSCPWETTVNMNSRFTGTSTCPHSKGKAKFVDVGLKAWFFLTSSSGNTHFSSWLLYFHSCWANCSWNEETLEDSTFLKVSTRETLTLAISVIILPLNNP